MASKKINKFEEKTVLLQIAGYYFPTNTIHGSKELEFDRAKKELLKDLYRDIANIKEITFEQFIKAKAKGI